MADNLPAPLVPAEVDEVPVRTFEGLSAPQLKTLIVDAGLSGYYTMRDAEDLISFYGLRNV